MYDKLLELNVEDLIYDDTILCTIMTTEGSDKGSGHHNYTKIYHYLFDELRGKALDVLEVGIGTTDPNIISNMGKDGIPGASLRGWKMYFPKANIVGVDIDTKILFEEDRIKTFYVDQTSEISVKLFYKEVNKKFDIIIDDGYHNFYANYNFLIHSLEHLKEGGIYVIEDIDVHNLSNFTDNLLMNLKEQYKLRYIQLVDIPNEKNSFDNRLLLIQK